MSSTPAVQLAGLQTEDRNLRTTDIDTVTTLELCRILNREDSRVPSAIESCIPVIAKVIDTLAERVRNGGRVFYIGAGTSGRLGVLDASEIPPTYSSPSDQFIALIAGGDHALRHAKEGAEDDRDGAEADLRPFNLDPTVDSLIGIASSGRTPYVLGGLSYAKSRGATTVAVVCVSPSAVEVEGNADYLIPAVTGPEVVTGSTRMKAGTATKLVLNMISTGIMIQLGKTYGNLMVDLKATNIKLKQRARNILRFIGGKSCIQSDQELDSILESCQGSVKLAAVTIVLKVSIAEAQDRLQRNKGVLARVFEEARGKNAMARSQEGGDLVLCVDSGGSSCKAVIMAKTGEVGAGCAGPCNVTNIGVESAMAVISEAVQNAVDDCKTIRGFQFQAIELSAAWVGMAGYGRPSLSPVIDKSLSKLLGLPLGPRLKITNDIDILPSAVTDRVDLDTVVVVVAGTGSVTMSYKKVNGEFHRANRVGGWGYIFGDGGSAYDIGREALRGALLSSDIYRLRKQLDPTTDIRTPPSLSQAIFQHFESLYPGSRAEDLLSTILVPDATLHDARDATLATTKRIAGLAHLVVSLAGSDDEARRIVQAGVSGLVDQVALLVQTQGIDTLESGLVLAGGMMQNELYRAMFATALENRCGQFKQTEHVAQPAVCGARCLLSQIKSTK
ncbi:putative glucokinase regulator family protein [Apodospora peruviana]|uniref:N-acetyl-D-glucosamine kinase n=1 Tax=Apodospora peruviana TaxID=516989 RepID=A0AAE0M0M8_9PEZI|nr:putative glucokinase regulator family protein [Apodospora peruviana]